MHSVNGGNEAADTAEGQSTRLGTTAVSVRRAETDSHSRQSVAMLLSSLGSCSDAPLGEDLPPQPSHSRADHTNQHNWSTTEKLLDCPVTDLQIRPVSKLKSEYEVLLIISAPIGRW